MAKNNNKGFSLVEVIVAVAVFAILIIPLTRQLITATNTNTRSVKKQYAIEKAEEIMENFKSADIDGSTVVMPDGKKKSDGTTADYVFALTGEANESASLSTGDTVAYNVKTYTCSDVSLGEKYETYTCEVQVSDMASAVSKLGYVWDSVAGDIRYDNATGNPVTISEATGVTRNLDNDKSAIIRTATYLGKNSGVTGDSLDNQAYAEFISRKADVLKDYSVAYNQYLSGAAYFADDYFEKTTTIKVSNVTGGGYKVECIVRYDDVTKFGTIKSAYESSGNSVYMPESSDGDGVVFSKEYEELPSVYLMYTPAVYNGSYCSSDYIKVDTSELTLPADTKFDVYIFESAASLDDSSADIINKQLGKAAGSDLGDLVYKSSKTYLTQSGVKVCVNLADSSSADCFNAYSNFAVDNDNSNISVMDLSDADGSGTGVYDISVTLEDSSHIKTTITGSRGK